MIEIIQNGATLRFSQIRIHRDAISIKFYALVEMDWVRIYKHNDERLPKYTEVDWPNPDKKFGWSLPYQV